MIDNVHPVLELRALSRRKRQRFMVKSVALSDVEHAIEDGWTTQRLGKRAARMTKPKAVDVWLEDRVWTLLYRMGFTHMSGEGGARLVMTPKDPKSPTNQLDVVGIDHEVALAIECKTQGQPEPQATANGPCKAGSDAGGFQSGNRNPVSGWS